MNKQMQEQAWTMAQAIIEEQKKTIRTLVYLCDDLRQPFNNSEKYHYLYKRACDVLNDLEERDQIH